MAKRERLHARRQLQIVGISAAPQATLAARYDLLQKLLAVTRAQPLAPAPRQMPALAATPQVLPPARPATCCAVSLASSVHAILPQKAD